MEKILPHVPDVSPLVGELIKAMNRFEGSVAEINTALYMQGFLTGLVVCATILTAVWAFSRKV